jgi:hypothetical protein
MPGQDKTPESEVAELPGELSDEALDRDENLWRVQTRCR